MPSVAAALLEALYLRAPVFAKRIEDRFEYVIDQSSDYTDEEMIKELREQIEQAFNCAGPPPGTVFECRYERVWGYWPRSV